MTGSNVTMDSSSLIAMASESDLQVQISKVFTNREIGSGWLGLQHSKVVNKLSSRSFGLLRLAMLSFTSPYHTDILSSYDKDTS